MWETLYALNIYSLCKTYLFWYICMCYNLHTMQIINLHGKFAPDWKNYIYSKIVIFACNYTRIGMIACNIYQNWYICSVQTITVCTILSIWRKLLSQWLIEQKRFLLLTIHHDGELIVSGENVSCDYLEKSDILKERFKTILSENTDE